MDFGSERTENNHLRSNKLSHNHVKCESNTRYGSMCYKRVRVVCGGIFRQEIERLWRETFGHSFMDIIGWQLERCVHLSEDRTMNLSSNTEICLYRS